MVLAGSQKVVAFCPNWAEQSPVETSNRGQAKPKQEAVHQFKPKHHGPTYPPLEVGCDPGCASKGRLKLRESGCMCKPTRVEMFLDADYVKVKVKCDEIDNLATEMIDDFGEK